MRARVSLLVFFILSAILAFGQNALAGITATPVGFTAALNADQQTTRDVILSNSSDREVPFAVKFRKVDRDQQQRGPRRDEPGHVFRQIDVGVGTFGGMAWDGSIMWGSSYGSNVVVGVDPADDQVVARFNAAGNPLSMAFDGENLWTTTWAGTRITVFDRRGNNVGAFDLGFGQHGGMATDDNGHILVNCINENSIHVINIEGHEDVAQFSYEGAMGNADVWGIEWVAAHPDGQLWGTSQRHVWEVYVDEDWNCHAVQDFAIQAENQHTEVAHDGENLWHGMWGSNIWYVVDDGVTEVYWLDVAPKEGVIAANDETELQFTFNSTGMENGLYEFYVDIEFPQDATYDVRMSAVLSVGNAVSSMHGVVTDAETGAPLEGVTATLDTYIIERPTDNHGAYEFTDLPLTTYVVTFTAPGYLPTSEQLNLDRNGAELNVGLLHGECNLSDARIGMELSPETETQVEFSITNGGNGALTYSSSRILPGDANAAPWELRRNINIGNMTGDDRVEGVAFDGNDFYFSGAAGNAPNTIYVVNRAGERTRNFNQLGGSRYGHKDLEYDGQTFWGAGDTTVWGFNSDGERVASFRGPANPTNNIAFDTEDNGLWLSGITSDIFEYDLGGHALGHQLSRKGLRIYGLAYWPDDPDGYNLYIMNLPAGGGMYIHKMNTANGDTMLAYQLTDSSNVGPAGMFITSTYDIYSWVLMTIQNVLPANGGDRLHIYQLDARRDWFSIRPTEGVIAAGSSQDFTLSLSAISLPLGHFEGIVIFNHDGRGGETRLPITLDVVNGPVQSARNLHLEMGWNLVSTNLQPDAPAFGELTRPLVDAGILRFVKDGQGHFMMVGGNNFNNLPDWNVAEGYMIKVTEPATLHLEGMTVMRDDTIHLQDGWQIVSYYPRQAVNTAVALAGIADQLQVAKDGSGNFYLPSYNYENIGEMHEGSGYQLKLNGAMDLVYELRGQRAASVSYASTRTNSGKYPIHPVTSSNMSVLVEASGYSGEIGIYADGMLVGTGLLDRGRAGVAVWGDDPTTSEVDGAVPGDALLVKIWDERGERVLPVSAVAGVPVYVADSFSVLKAEASVRPVSFGLAEVYPNPFNDRTMAAFSLANAGTIRLALFDLNGRLVQDLVYGRFEAGTHSVTISAGDLSSGVYLLRLEAGSMAQTRKLMLVR